MVTTDSTKAAGGVRIAGAKYRGRVVRTDVMGLSSRNAMLLQPHLEQADLPELVGPQVGAMDVRVCQQLLDIPGTEQSPFGRFRREQRVPHPGQITALQIDD